MMMIVEINLTPDNDNIKTKSRIYRVKSSKDKDKFYEVDLEKK